MDAVLGHERIDGLVGGSKCQRCPGCFRFGRRELCFGGGPDTFEHLGRSTPSLVRQRQGGRSLAALERAYAADN